MNEARLDPVTYEILQHRLWQITNEMGITLTRVTGSHISIDAKDYAAGLFRANGDLLMIGCGVIFHAISIPYGIRHILERYGEDPGINEGDVFIVNDPYVCAVHPADVYVFSPIYYRGELVGWAGSMTHLVDSGGMDPGSMQSRATEVFQEGVRLPGLKIVEGDKIRRDVWDSVLHMVRDPGMVGLDFRGQIAAGQVARRRVAELIDAYGSDTYKALGDEVIGYAEAKMRARLSELPNGTWQTRVYFDDDGMTDRVYEIALKMTKEGDSLVFDLTGTSEQAPSPINCGVTGAKAGIFGSLAPLLAYDIPWTQGVLNPIRVIAPEGTFVNPKFPAPCSKGTIAAADAVMSAAQDAIAKMLNSSEKYKEDFTAMWRQAAGNIQLSGLTQYGSWGVTLLMDTMAGGCGARSYVDGVDTGGVMYIPEATMPNVETYELDFPILWVLRREAMDTGGPGKFRGGVAAEFWLTLHDAPLGELLLHHVGRGAKAPLTIGLSGGYPSANSCLMIKRNADIQERLKSGTAPERFEQLKGTLQVLPANGVTGMTSQDVVLFRWHGGGGYGDPLDRHPEMVCKDVRGRFVSVEAARDVYGVIIDPMTLEVDIGETEERRKEIRKTRLQAKEW